MESLNVRPPRHPHHLLLALVIGLLPACGSPRTEAPEPGRADRGSRTEVGSRRADEWTLRLSLVPSLEEPNTDDDRLVVVLGDDSTARLTARPGSSRVPGDPFGRMEFADPVPFSVLRLPPECDEDTAYGAVFTEVWNRSILIGPPWLGKPLAGYERLATAEGEPVFWVRGFRADVDPDAAPITELELRTDTPTPRAPVTCGGLYPEPLSAVCQGADGELYWAFGEVLVRSDASGRPKTIAEAPAPIRSMAFSGVSLWAVCAEAGDGSVWTFPSDLDGEPREVPRPPGDPATIALSPAPAAPGFPGADDDERQTVQRWTTVDLARFYDLAGVEASGPGATVPASTTGHGRFWFAWNRDATVLVATRPTDSEQPDWQIRRTDGVPTALRPKGLIARADDGFWWAVGEAVELGHQGRLVDAAFDREHGLTPRLAGDDR